MASRFEDILSDCTERLLQGESVEQCLQRYPEQARELEPLLRVAAAARETASAVEPGPEFKDRTRYEIQSRLRAAEPKAGARKSSMMGWMPRWAVAAVSLVFVILLCGTTTVAASSDALPGDTLYGVKTTAEAVQLRLTFSEEGKARLQARFAERRAWEMARLAESGRTDRLRTLATRFGEHLARIEELAARIEATDPEDGERIAELQGDPVRQHGPGPGAPGEGGSEGAPAGRRGRRRGQVPADAEVREGHRRAGRAGEPAGGRGRLQRAARVRRRSEVADGSGLDGESGGGGPAGDGQQGTGTGLELKALAA